ncbi:MAG: carboxymuconolactone decarboxylase family protein [Pontibacterium sp.]
MSDNKQKGLNTRTQVMGQVFVDRAMNNTNEYTAPMQDWINEHAWGSTWQREGISRQTRSLVTIAMLAALKAPSLC